MMPGMVAFSVGARVEQLPCNKLILLKLPFLISKYNGRLLRYG